MRSLTTVTPYFPEVMVFILGCQRSGTTWLANIFDACPETLVFMEPFAPEYTIFPEFPKTNEFIEASPPSLTRFLRVEMPKRLLASKSLFFYKSMINPTWFRVERLLDRAFNKVWWGVPDRLQKRIRKFELLNLNRMDDNTLLYPKNTRPSVSIIKELRFAGKIPILQNAFPETNFIVIIRHPCATVYSILKWFERGRLVELRRDLETYLDKAEVQNVSKPYRNLLKRCRNGNMAHKIALYWRISYETMFRQLKKYSSFQFLVYEQLALQPKETVTQIFKQLGIPYSLSVDEYLFFSTHASVDMSNPITTLRKSSTYYRSWMDEISRTTERAVLEITGDSFLMPYFEPYYL